MFESDSDVVRHLGDKDWLINYLHTNGEKGYLWLLMLGMAFTMSGGPRQLIAFCYGYVFGGVWGVLFTLCTTLCGSVIIFYAAQFLLSQFLRQRFAHRYSQFQHFIGQRPFYNILLLRIFPIGSNLLTNLLSGVCRVPLWSFVAASLLGYLPQTVIFSLAGAGIGNASHWQFIVSVVLFILSLVLTHYLYRQYKHFHSINP